MTAPSHRLTNTDATDATTGSRPAAIRRSMPRRYASAAAMYCSRENRSVTFTGIPAAMASSIAGSPSGVPGILMNRFGRAARAYRSRAASRVAAAFRASRGETSSDTHPSTPSLRSWMGRNRSAACVRSSRASSKKSASPDFPSATFRRIAAS